MRNYLTLSLIICASSLFGQLKINEYSVQGGVMDLEENNDWIEIFNSGSEPVQLSDYYLSDDLSNTQKWMFPNFILPPSEMILVCASNKNITTKTDHFESIVLAENNWQYFPGNSEPPSNWNELSFDDSSWLTGIGGFGYGDEDDNTILESVSSVYMRQEFTITDIDDLSNIILHADYDDGYVAYINGIEISRSENILGTPPAYDDFAETNHEAEFYQGIIPEPIIWPMDELGSIINEGNNVLTIQLHNVNAFSSDMTGIFYLSAGIISSEYNYYPIPTWFNVTGNNQFYHTNFKLDFDQYVILSNALTTIDLDAVPDEMSLGISRGRSPDGTGDWCFFDDPTPNDSNGTSWCYEGVSASPNVSLPSGWYLDAQSTSLSATDAEIYYTTNGDTPDETSALYVDEINITETGVLSARAFSNLNLLPSPVVDRTYILNQDNHGLQVFSIITDSLNLWGFNEGIYVSGPSPDPNYPFYGSNFWQPWSRYSRLEYFNGAKEKLAEEQFDLEIHGGWSRAEPQKSFRIDFKSIYSGRLETPLFSQKPNLTSFNNINLRNGGQHLDTDKIQDGLISRIVNDTHSDLMAYEPCIVYLNGDYWGVYGIREKIDEHYVEDNHGYSSEIVDLINPGGLLAGTDEHIIETYLTLIEEPATSDEFYNMIDARFDIQNYMDYFIIETFIQNVDWLGIAWGLNNVKMWHPQVEGGKWRYILYDTDGGMGSFGGAIEDNFIDFARNPTVPSFHSQLFDKFLENDQFKCEFSNRYADLMNTIFLPENVQEHADEIVDQMFGAMPDHIDRWEVPNSMLEWQFWVDTKSDFAEDRLPFARNHVNSSMALNGEVNITLNVNPPGAGVIKISTITPENYPWSGVYFDGCMVNFQAIPNEGYSFVSWSENGILGSASTDSILDLNLFQDDVFIANFEDATSIHELSKDRLLQVFPNPSNGTFIVNFHSLSSLDAKMLVHNTIGEVVLSKSLGVINGPFTTSLDLSNLPKGVYVLSINASENQANAKLILK